MTTRSAFARWFEQHHGKLPGGSVSDRRLWDQVTRGDDARMILRAREIYDARRQAALAAWNARGKG